MTETCIWSVSGRTEVPQALRFLICWGGMGKDPEYYKRISSGVAAFIPEDCEYLGAFLCQGKMPIQVRKRYEAMRDPSNGVQIDRMIRNFDEALLHPDKKDFAAAAEFVKGLFR